MLPRPLAVAQATAEQLLDDMQEQLHSFMSEHIKATNDRSKASKTPVILKEFALHLRQSRGLDNGNPLDKRELHEAEQLLCRRATKISASHGVRNIMAFKHCTGRWLLLKPDGDDAGGDDA